MSNSSTVYEMITEQIVGQLEKGTVPWRMSWTPQSRPRNLVSNRAYTGVNVMLLVTRGYSSPYWMTFKQAKDLGGSVRKGEHGQLVVFWKMLEKHEIDETTGKTVKTTIPMLRYYRVFNLEQTDGVRVPAGREIPPERDDVEAIEAAEAIIAGYLAAGGPSVTYRGSQPAYSPPLDAVEVPEQSHFDSDAEFYGAVFHELGHSTGHPSRLNRYEPAAFGSHSYGREELVAEMTAAFLAGEAGTGSATIDNSAAYLAGWIKTIREDVRAVVVAAGAAQRAADYVLGRTRGEVVSD